MFMISVVFSHIIYNIYIYRNIIDDMMDGICLLLKEKNELINKI